MTDVSSTATYESETWVRALRNRLRGRSSLEREAARRLFNWREVMPQVHISDSCIMRLATTFPLTPTEVLHVAGAGHLCHAHVKSVIRIIRGVVSDARGNDATPTSYNGVDKDVKFVVVDGPTRPRSRSAVSLEPPHYFLNRGRTRACTTRNSPVKRSESPVDAVLPVTMTKPATNTTAATAHDVPGWFDGLDSLHECDRELSATKRPTSAGSGVALKPADEARQSIPTGCEDLPSALNGEPTAQPVPVQETMALSSSLIPLEVVLPGAPASPRVARPKSRKLRAMLVAGVGAWLAASPGVWTRLSAVSIPRPYIPPADTAAAAARAQPCPINHTITNTAVRVMPSVH